MFHAGYHVITGSDSCVKLEMGIPAPAHAEAYSIALVGPCVVVAGHDARGVLFGVGRLLRLLNISFIETYQVSNAVPPLNSMEHSHAGTHAYTHALTRPHPRVHLRRT